MGVVGRVRTWSGMHCNRSGVWSGSPKSTEYDSRRTRASDHLQGILKRDEWASVLMAAADDDEITGGAGN